MKKKSAFLISVVSVALLSVVGWTQLASQKTTNTHSAKVEATDEEILFVG